MFKFFPKEEQFFDLFGKEADCGLQASKILKRALDGELELKAAAQEVKQIEHDCDELTHELVVRLNRSFITPFDREDVYNLGTSLDDVVDALDMSTQHVTMYQVGSISAEARQLAFLNFSACQAIMRAIKALERPDQLREQIFECCHEINILERETDQVRANAIIALFEREKDPIAVIKWKEVYENLEFITDCCEDVGNVIESIIVKNA